MSRRHHGKRALLLMLLATRADRHDGTGAVGSAPDLAGRCSTSQDYAKRVLRDAMRDNMLERTERGHRLGDGTKRASVYTLVPPEQWASESDLDEVPLRGHHNAIPHGGHVDAAPQEGMSGAQGGLTAAQGGLSARQGDLGSLLTCANGAPGDPQGVATGDSPELNLRAANSLATRQAPPMPPPHLSEPSCEHGEPGGATLNPLGYVRCRACRKHQRARQIVGLR